MRYHFYRVSFFCSYPVSSPLPYHCGRSLPSAFCPKFVESHITTGVDSRSPGLCGRFSLTSLLLSWFPLYRRRHDLQRYTLRLIPICLSFWTLTLSLQSQTSSKAIHLNFPFPLTIKYWRCEFSHTQQYNWFKYWFLLTHHYNHTQVWHCSSYKTNWCIYTMRKLSYTLTFSHSFGQI